MGTWRPTGALALTALTLLGMKPVVEHSRYPSEGSLTPDLDLTPPPGPASGEGERRSRRWVFLAVMLGSLALAVVTGSLGLQKAAEAQGSGYSIPGIPGPPGVDAGPAPSVARPDAGARLLQSIVPDAGTKPSYGYGIGAGARDAGFLPTPGPFQRDGGFGGFNP
jgi:hypothetical protein